jgi:hypothetical protein
VDGQELRAVFDKVLFAEYHGHDDRREGKVQDLRVSRLYPSPFASRQQQGSLIERNPRESVVVYRPKALIRQAARPWRAEPLWLFQRLQIASRRARGGPVGLRLRAFVPLSLSSGHSIA